MRPLPGAVSPKSAAYQRVLERLAAGEGPESVVSATLGAASIVSAARDPRLSQAARLVVSIARDPHAALRALGQRPPRRPTSRLALVAAVAEALDEALDTSDDEALDTSDDTTTREPRPDVAGAGELAVLSAVEALLAAPEPLDAAAAPRLLRDMLTRFFERWLLAQLGPALGTHVGERFASVRAHEEFRAALAEHVRRASSAVEPIVARCGEAGADELPALIEDALAALERALGGAARPGGAR
ncbi:MAG: hypothetical protein HYV09_02160 [Deltaproteobacteria bacterium]|nr:hypothetical protein [Deltaproteobacteria bacterium]